MCVVFALISVVLTLLCVACAFVSWRNYRRAEEALKRHQRLTRHLMEP